MNCASEGNRKTPTLFGLAIMSSGTGDVERDTSGKPETVREFWRCSTFLKAVEVASEISLSNAIFEDGPMNC